MKSPEPENYSAMSRLSILALFVAMTALFLGGTALAKDDPGKGRLIVLFGARWCAPCMAEYRRLPELTATAAPDRLALAWVDRTIAPPPALASVIVSLPLDQARRLAHRSGGEGYGLPFAVMFDSADRPCAVWRAPLTTHDIATLRARCAA
jgi:hypothetical protein